MEEEDATGALVADCKFKGRGNELLVELSIG